MRECLMKNKNARLMPGVFYGIDSTSKFFGKLQNSNLRPQMPASRFE